MRSGFVLSILLVIGVVGCAQQRWAPPSSQDKDDNCSALTTLSPIRTAEYDSDFSEVETLTLRQALAWVLLHNPQLKAYALDVRAAEARQLQAGLSPNPELELEVAEFGGSGERRGLEGSEATIQLSQLVELGGKLDRRVAVAAHEIKLADIDYQSKRLKVLAQATRAFLAVLQAQEQAQLAGTLLAVSEDSYAAVVKKVQAGKESQVEETRASLALARRRLRQDEIQRNLVHARRSLATYWGQSEAPFERVIGDLYQTSPPPAFDDLQHQLKQSPAYTRWEAEIAKSQAVVDLEETSATNDITVAAGIQRFNETNDNTFVLGVSIPLPLSNRNQGARQEARHRLTQTREQQKATWQQLYNELNQHCRDLTNAYRRAQSIQDPLLAGAEKMLAAANTAYQQGKVDYLNVLDAQLTLFELRREYIEQLTVYHNARNEIERLIGTETSYVNLWEVEQ